MVSAHWYTRGPWIQSSPRPEQVFDMYGFPPALYDLSYRPAGSSELLEAVRSLPGVDAQPTREWGLDHGAWSMLVHMFPQADIPVLQLSVDGEKDGPHAYELGRRLAALRDQGYLVMGSGNTVHNLGMTDWDNPAGTPAGQHFEEALNDAVLGRDDARAINYLPLPDVGFAVPTPDHYLPLLTVLGASQDEVPQVFNRKHTLGSIAMTSYAFGMKE